MKRPQPSQSGLFPLGVDAYGHPIEAEPPAQRHSVTSVAAAEAIKPKLNDLHNRLLIAFTTVGQDGLTDEEGIAIVGITANTYRPRRIELVQAGLVRDSGKTRQTQSGRRAVVLVMTVARK